MWIIHKVHALHARLQHLVHGLSIKKLEQGFVIIILLCTQYYAPWCCLIVVAEVRQGNNVY